MDELFDFKSHREEMNEKIFNLQNKQINRLFALDTGAYLDGELSKKIKELLGLVSSLVLRCDDCVKYHMIRVVQEGCTDGEIAETLAIGLIVGGTITVPTLRNAVDNLSKLREMQTKGQSLEDLL
ncbi:MAG: carboxymuconolactone decarboxylase family protein [Candidatus Heimdallarchaeota archaeon]|nr:carboxymuconolactone decarboxylase family protein [Candidatus Heimdallarchaeota archaeon]MCK4877803.1 carboxymuconolactone decarboxylase family protein [Candidatus Heimdallarchaeota archaeon]